MWSYDDISIFAVVIEQGGFLNASKKLNVPCSTVSRRVAKLELDLNIKLLDRNSRKMRITTEGEKLYNQCSPLLSDIKKTVFSLSSSGNDICGKLKITSPTFLGRSLVGFWIIEFLSMYENIDLEYILSNNFSDIISDQIDIAIRIGPLADSSLVAQKLWSSRMVLCASPSYISTHSYVQSPDELKKHNLIHFRDNVEKWSFEKKDTGDLIDIKVSNGLYINDIELVLDAVTKGLGIACLPDISVTTLINSGQLIRIAPDYNVVPLRDIFAVYHNKNYISTSAKEFLSFIKGKFNNLQSSPA